MIFEKYREVRRLRRELSLSAVREASLLEKIDLLKARCDSLVEQLLERDFAWADRFLTAQVKTHAIGDQVRETLRGEVVKVDDKAARLAEFLAEKKVILREFALETEEDLAKIDLMVERAFVANEQMYMAEFEGQ
jgi:hypothetical protein